MKVLLAGKSRYSEDFRSALQDAGLEPVVAATPDGLSALPEETPVILLHDARISPLLTDGAALEQAVRGLSPKDRIVFLMDKEEDTRPYTESRVLEAAARLASLKRDAAVLLRSSRASDAGFEDRYLRARQKGVAFIKYETLDIKCDDDGVYSIDASDGSFLVSIDTPLLIDCAENPDPESDAFAEALRIRTYDDGRISGARWFLSGGATFKRNVKRIDTDAADGGVRTVTPSQLRDILALKYPEREETAFVDVEKCAFCYTCYRLCPHSALGKDPHVPAMKVNDLLCEACGVCISVCPAGAVAFRGAEASDRKAEAASGRLKVFCCENSAFIASKEALAGADAAVESVPCGGDVSAVMMTEALRSYAGAIVAVCCDDACKHRDGNKRCVRQIERLKGRLAQLGHDAGRLHCIQIGAAMTGVLRDAVRSFSAGGEI
ncbi:MAG: hydrogenase iron-sulfur subunit [Clostridiales Family XIII bacterium]|jgi:coenzyme F420-reducing hydrogenase delta subunit/Pyruvate/2-oxoacid:ferredoxin oxidoreductase delta subunit|nr:hydrogenase iron-sulfur subunit [Clostridiales Family XIII bacterium]